MARSLLATIFFGMALCMSAAVAVRAAQDIIIRDGRPTVEVTPPPIGTGLILGRAVDADSGKPISGATVSLYRPGTTGYEPVMTDAQGRFVFRNLAAGSLTLRAIKAGYLDGAYAKVLPNDQSDPGQPLDLGDDERMGEVTIKLWKYAVVGGTVVDESGEPMVGVIVRALPKKFIGGRPQFSIERTAGATAQTDDRGQFRLSTLVPGDYVFVVPVITTTWSRAMLRPTTPTAPRSANYSESSGSLFTWLGGSSSGGSGSATPFGDDRFTILDSSNRLSAIGSAPSIAGVTANGALLAYETTFHPAANALARAAVITLRSGEERVGVDFRMRPVPSVRVSGTLMGTDGPAGEFVLRLVQTEISALTTADPEVAQTVTDADGRFSFYGVPPGQYQIRGLKMPRPPASLVLNESSTSVRTSGGGGGSLIIDFGSSRTALPTLPTWWADTAVTVGDRNLDDAVVTLQLGFRISGRIEFEGPAPKPAAAAVSSVYVERADGSVSSNSSLALGRTDDKGQFATQGQRPGKYYVRMPYPPAGWFFKGAMIGDRDISAVPIDLSRDVEGVVIKFSDKPATQLSGLVTNQRGQPTPTAMVIVFTANQQVWGYSGQTPRNIRAVGVGNGGRYAVTNLPPGDYFVVAIGEALASWSDPKLLAAWARTAVRVTLVDGATKAQDVRVTTTPPREPQPIGETDDHAAGHGPFVIESPEHVEDQTPAPTPARDAQAPAVGTAVIAGVVMSDDQARQPIRKARVMLSGVAVFGSRVIVTDETGRFAFTDLPAGRFSLTASKPAYLAANYGAREVGRAGTTITLTDAQRFVDILLPMARGGVITGVIRDQTGQPVQGVGVQAMQYRIMGGERRLAAQPGSTGTELTDDRGQYRFFGLAPGEYVMGAAPRFSAGAARQTVEADVQAATQALKRTASQVVPAAGDAANQTATSARGKAFTYAPVFFPGTTVATDATMVIVMKGEEKSGIDFALQMVPTALVEGVVANPGGPLPSNLDVRLVAVGRVGPSPLDVGALLPIRPRPDGKFSYPSVSPGRYTVVALAPAAPAGRGGATSAGPATSVWATAEVSINGVDVTGLALSLQPGMTVSGRVTVDAKTLTPPSDFTGTRVSLQPILTGGQVSAGALSTTADAAGSFTMTGIMPGRYKMTSSFPTAGTGWMLRSAMVGGHDATEEAFEVPGGTDVSGIVITFTDRPSEVSGVLQDATGRPATDYFIILFPEDRALWGAGPRRVAQARPASDGRFTIRSLKAGTYLIAAVTDVEPGAIGDPAFLEQLIAGAVKLELAEGDKKVQDIRIAK